MKNKPARFFWWMGVLLLSACKPSVSPQEFAKHVENAENGYITEAGTENFTFRLMYTPPEYLAVNYLHTNRIKTEEFNRLLNGYAPFENYRLEIQSDDAKNMAPLVSYFSFYLQTQLTKVCGTDTTACIIYQAEPYNGMNRMQRIEIGFPKKECGSDAQIVLTGTPMSARPILISVPVPQEDIPQIELY